MKNRLLSGIFVLPFLLSGCAKEVSESALVGDWHAINEPDCVDQCDFELFAVEGTQTIYRAHFTSEGGNVYSGEFVKTGTNEYVIKAPVGEIPLTFIDGNLYHPWGREFSRITPANAKKD